MKSEFMLAFNEICESRHLSKDVVLEALQQALVSAYRRNMNVGNAQRVEAKIDPITGQARVYIEKEVVESIIDNKTEVTLTEAKDAMGNGVELGQTVMIESTPAEFGRIAAQTAKQVILQKVREAEREKLFEDFSDRVGEIVNGTVQSVTSQAVTVGLGRTEAIMPRNQQVPGERCRPHDKLRVYIVEVRKSTRGPQIIVSRNHRNMLRRLLEYEVPEIYNGAVEIRSIAREAGQRSKVAVAALQEGVDPVGACVGLRGVRIQSLVKELNDEKIDVIAWSPDQATFIAKALSPAKVNSVFLDDDPVEGKTALVVVPDDQLSLAIGREGQNARLAAKLTGWRIDIKSLYEAASEAFARAQRPEFATLAAQYGEIVAAAQQALAKKANDRPLAGEDYQAMNRIVNLIENTVIAGREAERQRRREAQAAARASVPPMAFELPLEQADLPQRVHMSLSESGMTTVGALMERLALDEAELLTLDGIGPDELVEIKAKLAQVQIPEKVQEAAPVEAEAPVEAAEVEAPSAEAVAEAAPEAVAEAVAAEPVSEGAAEVAVGAEAPEAVAAEAEPTPELVTELGPAELEGEETAEAGAADKKGGKKGKKKGRQLVFDEALGRVVAKRERRPSRRGEWGDFEEE
jgi:N utilization substance protein A